VLEFRPKRLRPLVAMAAGLALALGQAPISFPYLGLLAVPLLLSMLQGSGGLRAGFAIGWFAGFGYFGLSISWIVEPFLVDIGRYGWMAPFALILMSAGLALFWGLAFMLAGRWMRGRLSDAVVLAGFWALAEVLRSIVFTGFPWALVGYGWLETPVIQLVSVIGPHGLGFLLVLASGLLLWRKGMVIAALIAITSVGFGMMRLNQPVEIRDLTVRLVQPNAEQRLKWDREYIPVFYQRLLDLSASGPQADVVIWPEVAIAYLPDEDPGLRADIAAAAGAPVILGARRRDAQAFYNSLFVIDQNSNITGQYDKHHLVPFGEYMPLQGLADKLGLSGLANMVGGGMGSGEGPVVVQAGAVPAFLPLICYEAIFSRGLFTQIRPEWLVQITNDAWFGKISGPYQHLAQARVRAIEQGLPLARAANTGISAMVDPYGRIIDSIPLGEAGAIDADLPQALAPTPYVRSGYWLAIIAIAALLAAQLASLKLRRE